MTWERANQIFTVLFFLVAVIITATLFVKG